MGIFFGYNKQLTDLTPEPLISFFCTCRLSGFPAQWGSLVCEHTRLKIKMGVCLVVPKHNNVIIMICFFHPGVWVLMTAGGLCLQHRSGNKGGHCVPVQLLTAL